MKTNIYELRDPIHNFIHFGPDERRIIDSRPVQRLRYIHQLALTYLIYPGATHRRFEHSLGVMELAGRVYDVITEPENINDQVREIFPLITDHDFLRYWRKVLRVAALVHDIGHPPFSHSAEKELFPAGFDHESMTKQLISTREMRSLFDSLTPPIRVEDLIKVAIGPKRLPNTQFSDWEAVLAEIITGDSFGVDRIDYLLRDSHHAGVAYGKFDHFRLIETLRILPPPPVPAPELHQSELGFDAGLVANESSREPMLGILHGGLNAAEGLLLARYFMYSQVYFHPNRVVYNLHLREFLKKYFRSGKFPKDPRRHLMITDNEITTAMLSAAADPKQKAHAEAKRIIERNHFKTLYHRDLGEFREYPRGLKNLVDALEAEFGAANILASEYIEKGGPPDFPVELKDRRRSSSVAVSDVLKSLPVVSVGFIFIEPTLRTDRPPMDGKK